MTAAEFLDPEGGVGLPECLEETLGDLAGARVLAPNARGSLLAGAGRGGCAVWDMSTRGVVRRPGGGRGRRADPCRPSSGLGTGDSC